MTKKYTKRKHCRSGESTAAALRWAVTQTKAVFVIAVDGDGFLCTATARQRSASWVERGSRQSRAAAEGKHASPSEAVLEACQKVSKKAYSSEAGPPNTSFDQGSSLTLRHEQVRSFRAKRWADLSSAGARRKATAQHQQQDLQEENKDVDVVRHLRLLQSINDSCSISISRLDSINIY